jgi:hypothetical protein
MIDKSCSAEIVRREASARSGGRDQQVMIGRARFGDRQGEINRARARARSAGRDRQA